MNENIISVKGINKTFKVTSRSKAGLASSIKSVFKTKYKYVEALKDIDFEVKKGEIRGLIGSNGAGKSTLIKTMTGILYPTSGEVNVMGYTPWIDREKYVKNIGALFGQKTQLWWDLPAIDAFSLSKKLYNIPENIFKRNIDFFIEILNIREVVTKPVRQLSLGERMKCEFVNALIHEPELVFLDEPTIGLDIISKDAIRKFIKDVNKEKGTTFILTTHDISDIEDLCSNVTIINKGEKVYDDSFDNLKNYYENKRVIKAQLFEVPDPKKLDLFTVKSLKDLSLEVEVDLNKKNLKEQLYKVLDSFSIHDINISNINIEEVIKQIYAS
ncbi:ABC transporter ATP-binding protein [Oceanirhabdus seepicola]|uniref:ATP-binding cassette domain-containing protein n=1 Tax=Oceanirhabdus seepicola TaxID=2828781 RepID=A0A9J6NXF3_9CLOT|nr:ATP-binding cassette domain-containing protein [Oceanirhabdus seepicola]MCM1988939.1 ATP-binding cassette domain-containing protein [Oceanirhabdus seepicola]